MANLRIIKTNLTDSANAITATSEAAGHLITQTQLDTKVNTWRSTSLAAQTINVSWPTAKVVDSVALAFNNLILNSTVQIKLFTLFGDVVPVLDVGVDTVDFAYDPPAGFSSIGSASFAFGGGNYFSSFFASHSVERVQIIINSSGNPDGYMEISRIIIGDSWSPNINADYGMTVSFEDRTESVRTDAGDLISNRGTISRSARFNLSSMNQADKTELNKIFRSNGRAIPVFISLLPDNANAEEIVSGQIYGRLENDLAQTLSSFSIYVSGLSIIEI